ncbi:hypothetical protein Acr_00g0040680 [Actinidia rufa]|uniref:Uncharacterized protein n=1 Tax=Actinidia rufa TaxID=165716 RepID=A0A7J0DI94_9ERIC|nr:hypothetical protein Acr_00g0040680 [Actinidia rufa]
MLARNAVASIELGEFWGGISFKVRQTSNLDQGHQLSSLSIRRVYGLEIWVRVGICGKNKLVGLSKVMHRSALFGKLPSLPPVNMLLDLTEGTAQQFFEVLPLGLVPDHGQGWDTAIPEAYLCFKHMTP